MLIKTAITAGYKLKTDFHWHTLYGVVERCHIEGFHITYVGYLSTSGQTAGFVFLSKDPPTVSSIEKSNTTEITGSRVRQIYINTDSIFRMMQHSWTEFIIEQDVCFYV
jgi:hypothetical protein